MHERTEITEDLREFMNPSLYLSDLSLALLDQRLLISEFVWREL